MSTTPSRIDIEEKPAFSLPAAPALLVAVLALAMMGVAVWRIITTAIAADRGIGSVPLHILTIVLWTLVILVAVIATTGLTIVTPGTTKVVTFLGNYIGTLRRPGLSFVLPLTSRALVPVRIRNFETKEAKVNDLGGNPVNIAAIVVWQVEDTAKAHFRVDDYEDFIATQSESAVRHIATQYPYDTPNEDSMSLRRSADDISAELAREVQERVDDAGLTILEARISSLSYAPEIAQAMLQRQQAAAIVDARQTIVDGAVSMVELALEELERKDIVDLDPERKAAMVSNLLVVLCSDGQTQPVINAGGLYS